jgi:hypothetical protein
MTSLQATSLRVAIAAALTVFIACGGESPTGPKDPDPITNNPTGGGAFTVLLLAPSAQVTAGQQVTLTMTARGGTQSVRPGSILYTIKYDTTAFRWLTVSGGQGGVAGGGISAPGTVTVAAAAGSGFTVEGVAQTVFEAKQNAPITGFTFEVTELYDNAFADKKPSTTTGSATVGTASAAAPDRNSTGGGR